MKKAVLYARVSSALQEKEHTIDSQILALKKQITADQNTLVKEYIDDGYSGAMLNRPGMDELRRDLKTSLFDVIYFHNADRIARDVTYQNIIIGEILKQKKQIIINGKDYVHNPENKFTLTVLGAVSELERAKTTERIMRGRLYRLKQGNLLAHGHHIYGYKYIPKSENSPPSYVINEKEAKSIRYIFELYSQENIGINTVANRLNEEKILYRDNEPSWYKSRVKYILQNISYTGTKYFNTTTSTNVVNKFEGRKKYGKTILRDKSEWIGIKIPAIISQELFDKVQEKIEYNKKCFRNAKVTKLLSNLVTCGVCGTKCFVYRRYFKTKKTEKHYVYHRAIYKCGSTTMGTHNPEISSDILESHVFYLIQKNMLDPDKLKNCLDICKEDNEANKNKLEKELKNINKKVHSIKEQKKRIIDLYSAGNLEMVAYAERTRAYEKEIENLINERDELLKKLPLLFQPKTIHKALVKFTEDAKKRLAKCTDFNTKRQFLLDYIEQVEHRHSKGYDLVKVIGSVPILIEGKLATKNNEGNSAKFAKAKFIIKTSIFREEAQATLRRIDRENGLGESERLNSKEYGDLIYKNFPVFH